MNNQVPNRVTLHSSSPYFQKQKYKFMIFGHLVTEVNNK